MNMFARFDENPAMTLQVIKKTKRYRRTDVKTVYPTTNKVCAGYNHDLGRGTALHVVPGDKPTKNMYMCSLIKLHYAMT